MDQAHCWSQSLCQAICTLLLRADMSKVDDPSIKFPLMKKLTDCHTTPSRVLPSEVPTRAVGASPRTSHSTLEIRLYTQLLLLILTPLSVSCFFMTPNFLTQTHSRQKLIFYHLGNWPN
ncbi:hypothetical protein D1007_39328 [Hordeum vulgare]|nr:hypothetical protein D1007_39328 [Hordeum vulgare]